jgi:hypothetical protein
MKHFLACLVALFAVQAHAEVYYWEYKDWRVTVEAIDTGEDLRVTCWATTGGDGDPSFVIQTSNGDANPPYAYPAVRLDENAVRGYGTVMQQGEGILFETDAGWKTFGRVTAGYTDSGHAWASVSPYPQDNLATLQALRHANTMWVLRNNDVVYAASLRGFTAAYGKIAEQCGFSTAGVIN